MSSYFPEYVAISSTSNAKYFRPSLTDGFVKSEAVHVSERNVKLQVQYSSSQPGLIHLKCLDTGKYLSWDGNPVSGYCISAQQTNRLSDLSSNACTLVKYSPHTSWNGVSVFHLEFRCNSQWHPITEDSWGLLRSGERSDGSFYTNFVVQDWHWSALASNNNQNIVNSIVPFGNMRIGY